MSKEKIEKLLIEAIHEGIRFGRELESGTDKEKLLPTSIHATVRWRVKEILKKESNTLSTKERIEKRSEEIAEERLAKAIRKLKKDRGTNL
jgi:hypothetical protein